MMTEQEMESWKGKARQYKTTAEYRERLEREREEQQRQRQRDQPSVGVPGPGRRRRAPIQESERVWYYHDLEGAEFRNSRKKKQSDFKSRLLFNAPPLQRDRKKWLLDQKFYLLTAAPYCELSGHVFPPAELSLIKFSIRGGVIDRKHWLVDHGIKKWTDVGVHDSFCQNGKCFAASFRGKIQGNERKTGIPVDCSAHVASSVYGMNCNYGAILDALRMATEESFGDCVLVRRSDWNQVIGSYNWLREHEHPSNTDSRTSSREDLVERLMCVEDVYLTVLTAGGLKDNDATAELIDVTLQAEWTSYMLQADVICAYHFSRLGQFPQQAKFCSLGVAHATLFSLFEHVQDCGVFEGLHLKGSHIPPLVDTRPQNGANGRTLGPSVQTSSTTRTTLNDIPRSAGFNRPATIAGSARASAYSSNQRNYFGSVQARSTAERVIEELDDEVNAAQSANIISFGGDEIELAVPLRNLTTAESQNRSASGSYGERSAVDRLSDSQRPPMASPSDCSFSQRPSLTRQMRQWEKTDGAGPTSTRFNITGNLSQSRDAENLSNGRMPTILPPSIGKRNRQSARDQSSSSLLPPGFSTQSMPSANQNPSSTEARRFDPRPPLPKGVSDFF